MANVLIVDDEKSIRITLRKFLLDDGHKVNVAEDAVSARMMAAREFYDIILLDIILPKTTGVELLKVMKSESPDSLVIMMTGEPTVETATEAIRLGAFDYLVKPVTKDRIVTVVANAMKINLLQGEKLRLEEQNRSYKENLEQLVAERTRELEESELKTRTIVESTRDAIIAVNPEGLITVFNPAACIMFGCTESEMLNNHVSRIVPERLQERHQEAMDRYFRTGKPGNAMDQTIRLKALHAEGDEFEVELSLSSSSHTDPNLVVGIIRKVGGQG